MRKLKIVTASLLVLLVSACASADGIANKINPKVQEAYYNIYVGGTPEAGLSRSYFMVLDTVLPDYTANAMQVDGRTLSLEQSGNKHMFIGAEHYAVKDELPQPKQLLLVLAKAGSDTLEITSAEVVFKQTITFPSAPPQD
jgi:hypothetical protein